MKILDKEVEPGMVARFRNGETRVVAATEGGPCGRLLITWDTPIAHPDDDRKNTRWYYGADGGFFSHKETPNDIIEWVEDKPKYVIGAPYSSISFSPGALGNWSIGPVNQSVTVSMSKELFDEICRRKPMTFFECLLDSPDQVADAEKEVRFAKEMHKVFPDKEKG